MAQDVFTCDRCGRDFPHRRMKEVAYEEGRRRVMKKLCPTCLDEVMNESGGVRGIAGDEKAAAAHVKRDEGEPTRESFGERD